MYRVFSFLILCLLLSACSSFSQTYSYKPSGYTSCDYETQSSCQENACEWRVASASTAPDNSVSATCCPEGTDYQLCSADHTAYLWLDYDKIGSEIVKFLVLGKCGDLLGEFGEKPEELELIECSVGENDQLHSFLLQARYKVPGEQAHLVEDFFHEKYGMKPLTFECCGWGAPYSGKPVLRGIWDSDYISSELSMYSEEASSAVAWSDIPYFYVTLEVDEAP